MTTKEKIMTTADVAARFDALAEEGKFDQILDELYDENVKSIEPSHSPWKNVQGLDAVKRKGKEFNEMIEEMFGGYTNKSQVAGNFFVCTMGMDVKMKGQARMKLDEVALYEVKEGKIVMEQFFF